MESDKKYDHWLIEFEDVTQEDVLKVIGSYSWYSEVSVWKTLRDGIRIPSIQVVMKLWLRSGLDMLKTTFLKAIRFAGLEPPSFMISRSGRETTQMSSWRLDRVNYSVVEGDKSNNCKIHAERKRKFKDIEESKSKATHRTKRVLDYVDVINNSDFDTAYDIFKTKHPKITIDLEQFKATCYFAIMKANLTITDTNIKTSSELINNSGASTPATPGTPMDNSTSSTPVNGLLQGYTS